MKSYIRVGHLVIRAEDFPRLFTPEQRDELGFTDYCEAEDLEAARRKMNHSGQAESPLGGDGE